jgi:hypothetical protein
MLDRRSSSCARADNDIVFSLLLCAPLKSSSLSFFISPCLSLSYIQRTTDSEKEKDMDQRCLKLAAK